MTEKEKRIDKYQNLLIQTLISAVLSWGAFVSIILAVVYHESPMMDYLWQLGLMLWIAFHSHAQLSKIIDRSKLEGLNIFEEFED